MTMTMSQSLLDREQIADAHRLIEKHIRRTPVLEMDSTEFGLPAFPLTLKLELSQHTGSFKARGAVANLLMRQVPAAGVVAASGGNHGVAVAFAAQKFGVPARIFVPSVASAAKKKRIEEYGAHLEIAGESYSDALQASQRWIAEAGAMPVHAFDQRETVLGQGTVGVEVQEQAPEIDTLLVAVGGGGLIGGIATWYGGKIRIIGVEPKTAPTLSKALEAGHPVDAEAGGIAADSLAPRRVGEIMFPIAQKWVERVVLVSDEEIARAQQMLWKCARIAAEPGGAAALSALTSGEYRPAKDERVGVVICGGNTTAVDFSR
jgi:threonine dehydratase